MMMTIPQPVLWALQALEQAGYEAWLAGGCVRDVLLGREPKDFDLTTSATVEEMLRVFCGQRVIGTGLQHGTVTLLRDGMTMEITAFRSQEGGTRTLKDDLQCRDLTINAMAYHPLRGLCDPFHGQNDLHDRILRAVDDPDRRFGEDALRILRVLRFASVLGFAIEEQTQRAMRRCLPQLSGVSAERVAAEFIALLMGADVRRVLMESIDVIGAVIPEALPMKGFDQHTPYHMYTVLEHTAVVIQSIPAVPVLRLAAFFHDIAKPQCFFLDEGGTGHFYGHPAAGAAITDQVLSRLKLDNATRERAVLLVDQHDREIPATRAGVRRVLGKLGHDVFDQLILLKRADNLGQPEHVRFRQQELDQLEALRDELLAEEACFSLRDLALNGRDLIALGAEPGPEVGRMLSMLLDAVLSEKVPNTREALTELAQSHLPA